MVNSDGGQLLLGLEEVLQMSGTRVGGSGVVFLIEHFGDLHGAGDASVMR